MKHTILSTAQWAMLVFIALALAGCGVAIQSSNIVVEPPGPRNPTAPVEEKVVTLVPRTDLPTPYVEASGQGRPTPTPFSFNDFGVTPVRFQDTFSGVSFEYPGHWQISDLGQEQKENSRIYTISLRAPMPENQPKQQEGPLPPGVGAIDVTIWKDGAQSYDEAVALRQQQLRESEKQVTLVSQTEIKLADGLPAARFEMDTRNGRIIEVVAFTRTGVLLISGFGDLTLFDTILATVRTE